MLRKMRTRLLSLLLALSLCIGLIPGTAYAAMLHNDPAYNQEILSELTQLVGSEQEAEGYYALLQKYNLLDEEGNSVNSWDIFMDGRKVTLEEVRAELEKPDMDPEHLILVDDTPISLGDVKTILEIEDYIQYLRATYFDGQKWTQEQLDNLADLKQQINTSGIELLGANDNRRLIGRSGINHDARVSITDHGNGNLTATLTGAAEGQVVTFDYDSNCSWDPNSPSPFGTVTLTGTGDGAEVTQNFTVDLRPLPEDNYGRPFCINDSGLIYYLNCRNIKNALFDNNKDVCAIRCKVDPTATPEETNPSFTLTGKGEVLYNEQHDTYELKPDILELTPAQQNMFTWGLIDHISFSSKLMDENLLPKLGREVFSPEHGTPITKPGTLYVTEFEVHINPNPDPNTDGSTGESNSQRGEIYKPGWICTPKGGTSYTRFDQFMSFSPMEYNYFSYKTNSPKIGLGGKFGINKFDITKIRDDVWFVYKRDIHPKPDDFQSFPIDVKFDSVRAPVVEYAGNFTPPEEYSFFPGEVFLFMVHFNRPVQASTATAKINGQTCHAAETGNSDIISFPYVVPEGDAPSLVTITVSELSATGANGTPMPPWNGSREYQIKTAEADQYDAIEGITTCEIGNANSAEPVLHVGVKLSDKEALTNWMGSEFDTSDPQNVITKTLMVSIDGGETMYPLRLSQDHFTGATITADIPLQPNLSEQEQFHVVELFVRENESSKWPLFGKACGALQAPVKLVAQDDIAVTTTVKTTDGNDYVYADASNTIYVQDEPKVSASYSWKKGQNSEDFAFGTSEHIKWTSSDTKVANIDPATGVIAPTGTAGTVYFTLTADNGGIGDKEVTWNTEPLTFGVGLTPFLSIPSKTIQSVSGQPVTVYWSSNLCDKNEETPTAFHVSVKRNGAEKAHYETDLTGTRDVPASNCTIPSDALNFSYDEGASNSFEVTVSSKFGGKTYSDKATITLDSQPAKVAFNSLPSYYMTDEVRSLPISWSVENFDRYSNAATEQLFKFEVTRDGEPVHVSQDPGTGSGSFDGSYDLPIQPVAANSQDPTSYRDIYTVTVQAKNGKDSTWSYDSFMLYVYDADALKIWVNGKDAGDSLTMSNIPEISGMSQDEILALKRDIYLKDMISINYGEYAWTEVFDQIKWASSNSDAVSINYQRGSFYKKLEQLDYVSYRPTAEFGLNGCNDGTSSITAEHKLTGDREVLDVTVETLKDRLYLFQFYPQLKTELIYTNGNGQKKTVWSDDKGAAAIYEESGIASDIYCRAEESDIVYLGTYYQSRLSSGESDWTTMEQYPCNNLSLRRAAYADLYLKKPDGTPYTGKIKLRGGVYFNGTYKPEAKFSFDGTTVSIPGNQDNEINLGKDGYLEVMMDQSQWGLNMNLSARDRVAYVFEITAEDAYLPVLVTVDARCNSSAYVSTGSKVINFRENKAPGNAKHPFVISHLCSYQGGVPRDLLEYTDEIGISTDLPKNTLRSAVMWWGEDTTGEASALKLMTENGVEFKNCTVNHTTYPFTDFPVTELVMEMDKESLTPIIGQGNVSGAKLIYSLDGKTQTGQETLPFRITNLSGLKGVQHSGEISAQLNSIGELMSADPSSMNNVDVKDGYVETALALFSSSKYSNSQDSPVNYSLIVRMSPTSNPTKFLGFISTHFGDLKVEDQVSGNFMQDEQNGEGNFEYVPGFNDVRDILKDGVYGYIKDAYDTAASAKNGEVQDDLTFGVGGYAESLIYYDFNTKSWKIQILNGGFHAGISQGYTWNNNILVGGVVPVTTSLTVGGTGNIMMDTVTAAYVDANNIRGLGNDFLTELRIYLYLRFFGGLGIDYSVVALKAGVYGQIGMDIRMQWLNRPYMNGKTGVTNVADKTVSDPQNNHNLAAQNLKLQGQIGLEFVVKFMFVNYEKILCSAGFNETFPSENWDTIQSRWKTNQDAQKAAISGLINGNAASMMNVNGQPVVSLNLAPTMENRDYLEKGRSWGPGVGLLALDTQNGLQNLEYNSYPYANPLVTEDGQLLVYLTDQDSTDVTKTHVAFSTLNGASYEKGTNIPDGNVATGYGDSQFSLAGTGDFAVTAWTRQMTDIQKDSGTVLTQDDQTMMMNSNDIFASVYTESGWTTTRLTENGSADLAPVTAVSGNQAIVAWRAVSSSAADGNVSNFDEKDTILYKRYTNGNWDGPHVLYNGTSGSVKAITAAMLDNGTAAVAYTLDGDGNDQTLTDKEIYYAVVSGTDGSVIRNVRATNDGYLDENPQLTAVTFPAAEDNQQHFVLGWFAQQEAASDASRTLAGSGQNTVNTALSDIRLLDFDAQGTVGQLLPDSIGQAVDSAAVNITSNFRFTKGAGSINDLSIVWTERAERITTDSPSENTNNKVERDVLKGIKFYTSDRNDKLISYTGAIDIAEMDDGTLIDHFDTYVSNPETNEVKAVILGSHYGETVETKTGLLADGVTTVSIDVPSRTTSMYTATETYQDKIAVTGMMADYRTVRKNSTTQIQFTVKNNGIHAVDEISVKVGEGNEGNVYSNLNLMPGQSIRLVGDCSIGARVTNPTYTIQATFCNDSGATGTAETQSASYGLLGLQGGEDLTTVSGKIYLNLADLEITQARIVNEEDGLRTIQIKMANMNDSDLAGSGRKVKLSFFKDPTCQRPLSITVDGNASETFIINNQDDLKMMDNGGYSKQFTFNVGEYVKEDGQVREISESGVNVYIRAEVLDDKDNLQGEPSTVRNIASVTCENLRARTGKDVTLTNTLSSGEGGSLVSVELQNNRLTASSTGNLVVTLLDAQGNVLEQQQSFTGENSLITLNGEEKASRQFQFTKQGVSAQVQYSNLILGADSAELSALSFDGINVDLADFKLDPADGINKAEARADGLTSTLVTASAATAMAKVMLADSSKPASNILSEKIPLTPGEVRTITVKVESQDESATTVYQLTVVNDSDSPIPTPDVDPEQGGNTPDVDPEQGGNTPDVNPEQGGSTPSTTKHDLHISGSISNGAVEVSPKGKVEPGKRVTITPQPDPGYQVDSVTVTNSSGAKLEVKGSGNSYTFTMPNDEVQIAVTFKRIGAEYENPFTDVTEQDYFYDAVLWAQNANVTTGTTATTFSPGRSCTRAQTLTFLWRLAGCPEPNSRSTQFRDLNPEAYYYDAVLWATEKKITTGTSATTFEPNLVVNRSQTVTFLYRYAQEENGQHGNVFTDVPADSYFADAVQWAVAGGITNGTSATTFSPKNLCTRGQMVTFLYRYDQR